MSKELNKTLLMGRLTKPVDYRENTDTKVSRFTVAVGRDAENTDFINVVCFGHTAEFANKYLDKGSKIVVDGRIRTGSYTNKDGVKVYTTNVVAESIYFADSKKNETTNADGFKAINIEIDTDIQEELPFL